MVDMRSIAKLQSAPQIKYYSYLQLHQTYEFYVLRLRKHCLMGVSITIPFTQLNLKMAQLCNSNQDL